MKTFNGGVQQLWQGHFEQTADGQEKNLEGYRKVNQVVKFRGDKCICKNYG